MDISTMSKKEFIKNILLTMVTPSVKQRESSQVDDEKYKDFINKVKSGCDISVQLPLDYTLKSELFDFVKSGVVYIESVVKFIATFTTKKPDIIKNTFNSKYIGNEFSYSFLDNHPGIININKVKDIPNDYEGLMAVPVTVLEYRNISNFNIHKVIYAPKHNGKLIQARVVVTNKTVV